MTTRVPLAVAIVALSALTASAAGCGNHGTSTSGTLGTAPASATTTTSAAPPPPPPASLNGSILSLSANYPTADEVFTNTVTGTVPVSWPTGTLYSMRNKLVQVNASFDVTGTQVTETFLMNARLGTGTFNGPVYKFTGAPAIAKVTVDPQSDPTVAPTSIAFTADSISVNDSGLTVSNGAKQILDVTFALP